MRGTFGLVARMEHCGRRLRIPPAMRALGRIEGSALLLGAGDTIEIWNPVLALASEDELLRDLTAFQLEARETTGVH